MICMLHKHISSFYIFFAKQIQIGKQTDRVQSPSIGAIHSLYSRTDVVWFAALTPSQIYSQFRDFKGHPKAREGLVWASADFSSAVWGLKSIFVGCMMEQRLKLLPCSKKVLGLNPSLESVCIVFHVAPVNAGVLSVNSDFLPLPKTMTGMTSFSKIEVCVCLFVLHVCPWWTGNLSTV